MTYLSVGQFNLPIAWLALFIAILYSDIRTRHLDFATTKLIERLLYSYLIIWKFSYILFATTDFLQSPLSLLYFDGGIKGHILAIIISTMVLYKKRLDIVWEDGWRYWARFVTIFQLITYSFQEQWLAVALWGIVLIAVERKKSEWILLGQFLLLSWLNGFSASFTLLQVLIIAMLSLKKKQLQYLAMTGVFSLVSIMLGDSEVKIDKTLQPAIDLPTTTGEVYDLSTQEQSLTVVNFFATWCPPCKAEMPHLQSFSEHLPKDVALVGINLTARDQGEKALANFIDTYHVTYPILLDETDTVGTGFQVKSIPTTVLLTAQGEELERIVGPVSEEGLHTLIKKYQSIAKDS